MRMAVACVMVVLLGGLPAKADKPFDGMVKLKLRDRTIEGTPVAWNTDLVHFLERNGRLWEFRPDQARDYRKTSSRFRSYSVSELRAELLRDLNNHFGDGRSSGGGFEVSGTGHYLVAHRRGQRDRWAQRFEDLYRSFVHYFSVRGFRLSQPPFPLIGIVCRDQREFSQYLLRSGGAPAGNMLGVYNLESNRIVLYDMGVKTEAQWRKNAAVIIHEATHQTAFNTGLHNRYSPPPVWVAEGLATMFEAPGVYDSRNHTRRSDRINRDRLTTFRRRAAPRLRPETLADMIASDRSFQADPAGAYARAWALSFYLVETQPRQYTKYLALTADRPPWTNYAAAARTADFVSVFGSDWQMLQARLLRFIAELR